MMPGATGGLPASALLPENRGHKHTIYVPGFPTAEERNLRIVCPAGGQSSVRVHIGFSTVTGSPDVSTIRCEKTVEQLRASTC